MLFAIWACFKIGTLIWVVFLLAWPSKKGTLKKDTLCFRWTAGWFVSRRTRLQGAGTVEISHQTRSAGGIWQKRAAASWILCG